MQVYRQQDTFISGCGFNSPYLWLHVCLQTISHIPDVKVGAVYEKAGLLQDYTMPHT